MYRMSYVCANPCGIKKARANKICRAIFCQEQFWPRVSHAITRAYSGLQMRALFLSGEATALSLSLFSLGRLVPLMKQVFLRVVILNCWKPVSSIKNDYSLVYLTPVGGSHRRCRKKLLLELLCTNIYNLSIPLIFIYLVISD